MIKGPLYCCSAGFGNAFDIAASSLSYIETEPEPLMQHQLMQHQPMDDILGAMFDEFFPGLHDWGQQHVQHTQPSRSSSEELDAGPSQQVIYHSNGVAHHSNEAAPFCSAAVIPKQERSPPDSHRVSSDGKAGSGKAGSSSGVNQQQSQFSVRGTRKEVLRLEKELKDKLSLLTELEQQNNLLKRKEKLLKITVSNNERSFQHSDGTTFSTHVAELLVSFKSHVSKMEAEKLLRQRLPRIKDPASFCVEDYRMTWKSFADEVSALYLEYSSTCSSPTVEVANDVAWEQLYGPRSSKIQSFVMAVSMHCPMVMEQIYSVNLQTGNPEDSTEAHWEKVIERCCLSKEQMGDMAAAYELYTSCSSTVFTERKSLSEELQRLANLDFTAQHRDYAVQVAMAELLPRMQANLKRGSVLQMMELFLGLSLMNAGQRGVLVLESWPFMPNLSEIMRLLNTRIGSCGLLGGSTLLVPSDAAAAAGAGAAKASRK